jgi:hypothetical protein
MESKFKWEDGVQMESGKRKDGRVMSFRNINIAMVDSLMSVFGMERVSPTDEEIKMEESRPESKMNVDDSIYIEGTFRVVTDVQWNEDHYEYEFRPYPSRMIREDELD